MDEPADRKSLIAGMIGQTQPRSVDYRAHGAAGLKQHAGYLFQENDPKLRGQLGARVWKEMGDTDPTCAAIMRLVYQLTAGVKWFVTPASDMPEDKEAADFLTECLDDLDKPFSDTVIENMSMVQYGFALHEIVYKRRCGKAQERWMRSKYSDGRIGWRALPIRAQDTIYRWGFADDGTLEYVQQQPPPSYGVLTIPMEKCLLFRTSTMFGNPEGISMLRSCHRPWWRMQAVEEFEGIGVERDLAGIPIAMVPSQIMSSNATESERSMYHACQDIVTRTRNNEQAGIVWPGDRDENGNPLFEFKLIGSSGARAHDTDKIISRYKSDMARAALADFIMLGSSSGASGSWAMHSDKTKMFVDSLVAYLKQIKDIYNTQAIPKLFELNTFQVTELPKVEHTSLDAIDAKDLSASILALTQAGMPIFPNEAAAKRIMEILGLPEPPDADRIARQAMAPTRATGDGAPIKEIPGDAPTDGTQDGPIKAGPDSPVRRG